ncbi:MAG: acylneuraminate cytidylyltransferase family protein [Marinoscillum sp.]|uniref:acylneuraminate cytidylyltransferase family protein n=1 Tax=Marinoscillum sp. TaxID=2024838 RepID=UPI0032F2DD60
MFVLIPARGGSKGVARKNIRKLGDKPLIHYTIDSAREIFPDEKIIVSTDDIEIKKVVEQTGLKVPFLRPLHLATDTSSTRDVILHAISYLENQGEDHELIVLLQPTSPFRTATHIEEALCLYSHDLDMVVGVKETKSNPYYVLYEEDQLGNLQKSKEGGFTRRQDCPKVWEFNGAIYIINKGSILNSGFQDFKKIKKYEMSEGDSVDIDTEFDWVFAEMLLRGN